MIFFLLFLHSLIRCIFEFISHLFSIFFRLVSVEFTFFWCCCLSFSLSSFILYRLQIDGLWVNIQSHLSVKTYSIQQKRVSNAQFLSTIYIRNGQATNKLLKWCSSKTQQIIQCNEIALRSKIKIHHIF